MKGNPEGSAGGETPFTAQVDGSGRGHRWTRGPGTEGQVAFPGWGGDDVLGHGILAHSGQEERCVQSGITLVP